MSSESESPDEVGGVDGIEGSTDTIEEGRAAPEEPVVEPAVLEAGPGAEFPDKTPEETAATAGEKIGEEPDEQESVVVSADPRAEGGVTEETAPGGPDVPVAERGKERREEIIPEKEPAEVPNWEDFIYRLIVMDDLPGAYWGARSREQSNSEAKTPSWLIEALLGARLLSWDNEGIGGDLLQITMSTFPTKMTLTELLDWQLPEASSISPNSGMVSWLR